MSARELVNTPADPRCCRPVQAAKEALEQRQRADAKLRKEGGCSHGH